MVLLKLEIPLVGHEIGLLLLEFSLTVNPSFSAVLIQPGFNVNIIFFKNTVTVAFDDVILDPGLCTDRFAKVIFARGPGIKSVFSNSAIYIFLKY
jgi:hypothetical protein